MRLMITAAVGLCLLSRIAAAQTAAPSPEALKAAHDVVAQTQGNRDAVIKAMATPMIGFIQQVGVKDPNRAQVIVQEVILPEVSAHIDDLADRQALIYAKTLSVSDLQAMSAFYATPAGHDLLAAQPMLTPALIQNVTEWMSSFAPEMQSKVAQAAAAHGWISKPPAK